MSAGVLNHIMDTAEYPSLKHCRCVATVAFTKGASRLAWPVPVSSTTPLVYLKMQLVKICVLIALLACEEFQSCAFEVHNSPDGSVHGLLTVSSWDGLKWSSQSFLVR